MTKKVYGNRAVGEAPVLDHHLTSPRHFLVQDGTQTASPAEDFEFGFENIRNYVTLPYICAQTQKSQEDGKSGRRSIMSGPLLAD